MYDNLGDVDKDRIKKAAMVLLGIVAKAPSDVVTISLINDMAIITYSFRSLVITIADWNRIIGEWLD